MLTVTGYTHQEFHERWKRLSASLKNRVVNKAHGRRYHYGPPTGEWTNKVMISTYVEWRQIAADVGWYLSENDTTAIVKLGPFGVHITAARETARPEVDDFGLLHTRRFRNNTITTWWYWRHLGVCLDVAPSLGVVKGNIGPFGFAVETERGDA